jgi:predicted GNAT family acetyltransferase
MEANVIDHQDVSRFELPLDGDVAVACYRLDGGRIVLTHTEVPPRFSGQGVGSRLAKGVFDAIRASGRKVVTQCPFMAAYAGRHPEYTDLLDG